MIFVSSCMRFRGADYSQMGLFAGEKFAGAYAVIYVFKNIAVAMFVTLFLQTIFCLCSQD